MGMSALEIRRRVMLAQPHKAVASGAVASFRTDVVSALPMEFDLVPIQAGTGDPSPENVRPITGHDGFTRTRTGKNLFGGNLMRDGVLASMPDDATDDAEDRAVKFAANSTTVQTITAESGLSNRFKEKTQYTFVLTLRKSTGQGGNLRIYYTDGTYLATSGYSTTKTTRVFVTSATKTVRSLNKANSSGTTYLYYDECGIFEGELTEAEFEAYTGVAKETTFPNPPGTVYGGTVTDNGDGTGTLELTHVIADMGNLTWNYASQYGYMLSNINGIKTYSSGETPSIVCEIYKTTYAQSASEWASAENGTIGTRATYANIVVKDTAYTDKDAFKTAVTGYKVVYPLAEPQTYTLPLDIIQSLIGQNNIWVDNADSVTVEYWGH